MLYDLINQKCEPCKGDVEPLNTAEEDSYHSEVPVWGIHREGTHYIDRKFSFKDFKESIRFVNLVADLAEQEGHHPEMEISWNRVRLALHTHAIGGLSRNDFIMAAKVDRIYKKSE